MFYMVLSTSQGFKIFTGYYWNFYKTHCRESSEKLHTIFHFEYDTTHRSSHPEVFLRKGVLKTCSKFTGEHPCRSVISIKFLFLRKPLDDCLCTHLFRRCCGVPRHWNSPLTIIPSLVHSFSHSSMLNNVRRVSKNMNYGVLSVFSGNSKKYVHKTLFKYSDLLSRALLENCHIIYSVI